MFCCCFCAWWEHVLMWPFLFLFVFFSEGPSTKVGAKWSRLSSLRMATSSLHQSSVLCVELAYSFHNTGSSSCERSKSVYYFTQCSSQATFWYKPSFSSSSSPASTLHWKEARAYRPTSTTSLLLLLLSLSQWPVGQQHSKGHSTTQTSAFIQKGTWRLDLFDKNGLSVQKRHM